MKFSLTGGLLTFLLLNGFKEAVAATNEKLIRHKDGESSIWREGSRRTGVSQDCNIALEIQCVPTEGEASSCDEIPPTNTKCEGPPSELHFKYTRGKCTDSMNEQDDDSFSCEDMVEDDTLPEAAYIVAAAAEDESVVYFAGTVESNQVYKIPDLIGESISIDIYDSEESTYLLQFVRFHSSCNQNLFLKDRYGAHQLVGFFNPQQGLVDCFVTTDHIFTIYSTADGPVTLDSLEATFVPGLFGLPDPSTVLSEQVSEVIVWTGVPFAAYYTNATIDMSVLGQHTVSASVTATSADGTSICTSDASLEFDVGDP